MLKRTFASAWVSLIITSFYLSCIAVGHVTVLPKICYYISFLETLQQKYPEGHLTEKPFLDYMDSDSDSSYKSVTVPLVKRTFAATDRDNSGKYDQFYVRR